MTQILVLVVVSGVIAYLGDLLGTMVGKKRLTLFGLRPRLTALLVAISTGIIITLLTLGVAASLSENVRIALFSVEELSREKDSLEKETEALSAERDRLQESVNRLNDQVRIKQEKLVVFQKNEPLAAKVIAAGRPPNDIMKDMTGFIIALAEKAKSRNLIVQDEITFFTENRDQLHKMSELIASQSGEMLIAATANENINVGEPLGKVRLEIRPNVLVFRQGQEIGALEIDGSLDRSSIAVILRQFMDEIYHEVVRRGMIGNSLTERFDDLSSESMLSFYDQVNKISRLGRTVVLIARVQQDTFTIGPLNIAFRIADSDDPIPEFIDQRPEPAASPTVAPGQDGK